MFHRKMIGIFSAFGMLLCIFDARTVMSSAGEAINLCLQTVIPSLFPFFFLSNTMMYGISDWNGKILIQICKLMGIPSNCVPILLGSILGGYPTGALLVAESWKSNTLDKKAAHQLLSFCNNAGPAFLFGIVSHCFSKKSIPWMLWGIHILSAILTGLVFRWKETHDMPSYPKKKGSFAQTLQKSVQAIASVCGWVVLFRILTDFFKLWFLWRFDTIGQTVFISLLELTNGCLTAGSIQQESFRFIVCAGVLSWGGLCVAMQTVSVTQGLGTGMYFPGKVLQSLFSVLIATLLSPLFFSDEIDPSLCLIICISCTICIFLFIIIKKMWHSKKNCSILV